MFLQHGKGYYTSKVPNIQAFTEKKNSDQIQGILRVDHGAILQQFLIEAGKGEKVVGMFSSSAETSGSSQCANWSSPQPKSLVNIGNQFSTSHHLDNYN